MCPLFLQPSRRLGKSDVVADQHPDFSNRCRYRFDQSISGLYNLRLTELEIWCVDIEQMKFSVNAGNVTVGVDNDVGVENLSSFVA